MRNILAILAALCFTAAAVPAQQRPTTTWPYLYPEFQDGVIYFLGGQKVFHKLNVHLMKGRLHYIDSEIIKEAQAGEIFYVEIGPKPDKFIVVNGDMMRVEAESPSGFVACRITGDFESLMTGTGAYGMTANTEAIQQYSSLNVRPGVNTNHMLLHEEKSEGQEFDLVEELFLVTGDQVIRAYRKDVERTFADKEAKAAFKTFLKQNKIKWKDPQSLLKVVDFLYNTER